eukprot:CAMPEP_0118810034 /NCGR_PEP_ID=MMETSP1162-20130426/702_1 /TAXON_ID=33656 /ORGANISM="Phaeocystis Sp, Strain CCMP2710" /LENGTH=126 /DNA_ID=CAMNT_0006739513 /DNA_START=226 /DNA_END=606 /DNA_ORIENTATION=+
MVAPSGGGDCARGDNQRTDTLCGGGGGAATGGSSWEASAPLHPRRGMPARYPPAPASAPYPPSCPHLASSRCASASSLTAVYRYTADDENTPPVPEALRPQDTPAWSTGEVDGHAAIDGVSGCQHQ